MGEEDKEIIEAMLRGGRMSIHDARRRARLDVKNQAKAKADKKAVAKVEAEAKVEAKKEEKAAAYSASHQGKSK